MQVLTKRGLTPPPPPTSLHRYFSLPLSTSLVFPFASSDHATRVHAVCMVPRFQCQRLPPSVCPASLLRLQRKHSTFLNGTRYAYLFFNHSQWCLNSPLIWLVVNQNVHAHSFHRCPPCFQQCFSPSGLREEYCVLGSPDLAADVCCQCRPCHVLCFVHLSVHVSCSGRLFCHNHAQCGSTGGCWRATQPTICDQHSGWSSALPACIVAESIPVGA